MDKKSEYQDQINKLGKQIVKEPENVIWYMIRAQICLLASIDFDEKNVKSINECYKKEYEEYLNKINSLIPATIKKMHNQADYFEKNRDYKDLFIQYDITYHYAISCYNDRKYEEALTHLNDIIKSDSDNYKAIFLRSMTQKKSGFLDKAAKDEKTIENALSENNSLYEDIGIIYYRIGEWDKAIECFRKVEWNLSKEAIEIIEKISNSYLKLGKYEKAKNVCEDYLCNLYDSWWQVEYPLREHLQYINDRQKESEIFQAKIDERDRIIRNQAHDIKNIINTIINPLMYLKRTTQNPQIDQALKQAQVISRMVNATSLSYSGSKEDFYYDAGSSSKGMKLSEMIKMSLEASIGNIMEDIQYYSAFWEQYFPDYDIYEKSLSEYRQIQNLIQGDRLEKLIAFIKKYLFKIKIDLGNSENYALGNSKNSDVKMLSLFNEIIFNAVKYVSFTPKEKRVIAINFNDVLDSIKLSVENNCSEEVDVKSTGTGNLIINNMVKIMGGRTSCDFIRKENKYIISVNIPNYWKVKKE